MSVWWGGVYVLFSSSHVANNTDTASGPLRLYIRGFVLNCPFLELLTQTHHWNTASFWRHSTRFPVNILKLAGARTICTSLPSYSDPHTHAPVSCFHVMCCLNHAGSQESDSSQTAKKDMLAALRARQEALEETLKQRLEELKTICIREAVLENTFGKYFETKILLSFSF